MKTCNKKIITIPHKSLDWKIIYFEFNMSNKKMLHKVMFNCKNFSLIIVAIVALVQRTMCKFCYKEQPELNLFCIKCNKRDWDKK